MIRITNKASTPTWAHLFQAVGALLANRSTNLRLATALRHCPPQLRSLAIISSQRTNTPSYSSFRCNMDIQSGPARFVVLFEPALQAYEKNMGITLAEHPLARQLRSCHSIESITSVLLGEAKAYGEFEGSDRVNKSIKNTVSILTTLFATAFLDEAIDLVRQKVLVVCSTTLNVFFQSSSPRNAICTGLAILLAVRASF